MNWIKFSDKKPKNSGIYVVISHKKQTLIHLDIYKESNSKRILKCNEEKKIQWATWGYNEECENITEEHVIYKKNWMFFDDHRNPINDVIYFCELPKYPKGIENENK